MNSIEEIPMVNYTYIFDFENDFNYADKRAWMIKNWKQCFYYVGLYMVLIFGGRHYMQSRPRFELRGPLFFWNLFLALFSIFGSIRTLPEIFYVLREFGFHHSVCNPSFVEHTKVSGFWTWMFILSKVPELGDTVFIVLRKQPLIFLHWYHHVTVLLYAWYSYAGHTAPGRWFMVMNYAVHSCMYSYYALKALRFKIPRHLSMFITTAQLGQMVFGCYINVYGYQKKAAGEQCHVTDENIKISLLMYFSYFVLFSHFFYNAYLHRKAARASMKKD
ncbi:hypothetical protein CHUAL_003505 [Chamberlinius hualienensis]